MSVILHLARGVASVGTKVLPKAEQVAVTGRVFETGGSNAAYQAGHTEFALGLIRQVAKELGIKLPQTAEASIGSARAIGSKGLLQLPKEPAAGHTIEMTPIGEIIKGNIRNAETFAAKSGAQTEAMLPQAINTAGEKPPLVDLVREIVKGAKYEGATVTKQNGTTTINFQEGAWKGAQAVADDTHILTDFNGRIADHALTPIRSFEKMTNRFVNG